MAFSLIPYSRKSCIDRARIDKHRTAFIQVDLKWYVFGRLVRSDFSVVTCIHVDARTPVYSKGLPELRAKELTLVRETIDEMRKRKYVDYDQLVMYRLRKHIQRLREVPSE